MDFRGKASGFCVYNDCSVAIRYIQEKYHAKVLYIDTDAHHGDGVQWSFYDDPSVCTLSIHETGRYLFPGTGDIMKEVMIKVMDFPLIFPWMPLQKMNHGLVVTRRAISEVAAFLSQMLF